MISLFSLSRATAGGGHLLLLAYRSSGEEWPDYFGRCALN